MFICPYDAHWCEREACRGGVCELTGERPMFACIGCGAVVETSPKLRLCVDCIFIEVETEQGA